VRGNDAYWLEKEINKEKERKKKSAWLIIIL